MSALGPTGALLGAAAGCGLLLVLLAVFAPRTRAVRRGGALARIVQQADVPRLTVPGLLAGCVLAALVAGTIGLVATGLPVVGILAAALAAFAPGAQEPQAQVTIRRVTARTRCRAKPCADGCR